MNSNAEIYFIVVTGMCVPSCCLQGSMIEFFDRAFLVQSMAVETKCAVNTRCKLVSLPYESAKKKGKGQSFSNLDSFSNTGWSKIIQLILFLKKEQKEVIICLLFSCKDAI